MSDPKPDLPATPHDLASAINAAFANLSPEERKTFLYELREGVDFCWECGWPYPEWGYCHCTNDE